MVLIPDGTPCGGSSPFTEEEGPPEVTGSRGGTSAIEQDADDGMQGVRLLFREQGLSEQTTAILMSSWKPSTRRQYGVSIRRWLSYCAEREIDPVRPSLNQSLEFFTMLFEKGLAYDSMNTARGALSSLGLKFDGFRVGNHPLVVRYMRGVFQMKPPKPRYTNIWDVNLVLDFLRTLSPVRQLSLKDLTLKLTMLMALIQAARIQTLQLISAVGYKKTDEDFIFSLSDSLKQTRPSSNVLLVSFKAYPPDRRLCVYSVIEEYLLRTEELRRCLKNEENNLLLSFIKPFKRVSRDTISRWLKMVMVKAGIDVTRFGACSVRAAAASKAKVKGVPVGDILLRAGWSNEKTFARFYQRPVLDSVDTFQEGVLA